MQMQGALCGGMYTIETSEMEEKKRRDAEERMHIHVHVAKLHEMKVMEIACREHEVRSTTLN